jgi:hypothetical protein
MHSQLLRYASYVKFVFPPCVSGQLHFGSSLHPARLHLFGGMLGYARGAISAYRERQFLIIEVTLFPKQPALELATCALRQRPAKPNPLRHFVIGQARA